jgi:hypothetical protein
VILQTLDIKNNCKGIFHEGKFLLDAPREKLDLYSVAWKHSPMLEDERFQYLYLSLRSDELENYCSDSELFLEYKRRMSSHMKAAITAKVSLEDECFFDLLPEHQLLKWFSLRQRSLEALHASTRKQNDYDILHKAHVLTSEIAQQDITFQDKKGRVLYNIFGSATGRLTTNRGSVPVLTLKKEQRRFLKPQNDAFVEMDLNAAEVRTLMALSGKDQPKGDIHDWVVENVFDSSIERSAAKVELFAWLYNPLNSKSRFDKIFSRTIFRDFYSYEDRILTTPFGRSLPVEERKAQNYLLQSTTSDIVIQNAYKIMKLLKKTKSRIAFTLHDSIIIDMDKKDASTLKEIKDQFEQTPWGAFKSTCKIGKTFGDLKDIEI